MVTVEKLLVFGDDDSPGADDAWRWIEAQRWPGWRVDVIAARPPEAGPPLGPEETEPHVWDPPEERSASPSSEIASIRHLEARSDPRLALLRPDADLIVVGPRGRGVLKALHLGSTADYLLNHPPAPLVIARAPRPVRRVLLGADGSIHARRAAEVLAGMPWVDEAEVSILGVEDGGGELDSGRDHARSVLEGVAARVKDLRATGSAPAVVLGQAEEMEADLVVLGTRGILGVRRLLLGSTASAVARVSPCSVLTVCAES